MEGRGADAEGPGGGGREGGGEGNGGLEEGGAEALGEADGRREGGKCPGAPGRVAHDHPQLEAMASVGGTGRELQTANNFMHVQDNSEWCKKPSWSVIFRLPM